MKSNKNISKLLSCVFFKDVLCSFRKSEGSGIMSRCLNCSHYERFFREMDEEDERVMDEIDELRRRYESMDESPVEFRMANFCWYCARRLDDMNSSDVEYVCSRCRDTVTGVDDGG